MRIGIDLQAMQTLNSGKRGIGRYTYELTKSILRNSIDNEVFLGLNSRYQESIPEITTAFSGTASNRRFFYYDLIPTSSTNRDVFFEINGLMLKYQYFNQRLDILHFASIFEGFSEEAVVPSNLRGLEPAIKSVTLYDLIPLIYKDVYCKNESFAKWYFQKLHVLYQADLILAISESTRNDAINLLGIPEDRITNISGAVNAETFRKIDISPDEAQTFKQRYGIIKGFILYTGGIDYRKNIETALRAYSALSPDLLHNYQFVLVCKISPLEKGHLEGFIRQCGIPPGRIILAGYVSDNDLNIFYNLCDLFVFPSLYEGFGLPVLEAMNCEAPVIGSNSSSIPEIVGNQKYLFDPADTRELAEKMTTVLQKPVLQYEMREHSRHQSRNFSWDKSAAAAVDAFKAVHRNRRPSAGHHAMSYRRPLRIAYFSPLPNQKSGIADFSEDLLPFLARHFDLDIYIDSYTVCSDMLVNNYRIYNYRLFDLKKAGYDTILYHVGNSRYHSYMYDILLKNPGIVVLHDFFLGHFMHDHSTLLQDNRAFFFDSVRYCHGPLGDDYIRKYQASKIGIEAIIFDLPINKRILDHAHSVIVHSEYASSLFHTYYPTAPLTKLITLNQPIKIARFPSQDEKRRAKMDLHYEPDSILICAFGHIVETKQYDFIIRSMDNMDILRERHVHIVFVGELPEHHYGERVRRLIADSAVRQLFHVTGYVDAATYKRYLVATDIGINLRVKSRGETSRALLMNMAYGIPTIVNNEASFAEFPDNAVVKTSTNDFAQFQRCLATLVKDKGYRGEISENAYAYVKQNHAPDKIAEDYFRVIQSSISVRDNSGKSEQDPVQDLIESIADIIVENNIPHDHYGSIAKLVHRHIIND